MPFGKKQIFGLAIAAMLSLAFVMPTFAANNDSGTVTITTTVDASLTLTVSPETLTIPGDMFACNPASTPVLITIFSNAPYTASFDASSTGPIPVTRLWRDSVGAKNCGATSGASLQSGTNAWITPPAPATSATGVTYAQHYSLKLDFAGQGTTTFTITFSATQ